MAITKDDKTYEEQFDDMFALMSQDLGVPIRFGHQYIDKPATVDKDVQKTNYPYISWIIINSNRVSNIKYFEQLVDGELEWWTEQFQFMFSITAVSNNYYESMELAHTIESWFKNVRREDLSYKKIAFVTSSIATSRDFIIVDNFERRFGLDVTLRFGRTTHKKSTYIETVNIPDGEIIT